MIDYENSGLPGFVYLSAFLLRNKKIHSETLLCFHSAHQESLNRRRSHSSRPIPWDIMNFQIQRNFSNYFLYYETFPFNE